jgi:hypothetical protein
MRKAWIENEVIRDIAPTGNPEQFYHPDIAKFYDTEVPDDAENGDTFANGVLTKRPVPEPAPITPEPVAAPLPKLTPVEFKLCFTPQERIAIKAERANDPVLEDAFDILDDPRLTFVDLGLASTQGLIDYCVTKDLVTTERADQIKAGVFL